MTRGADNRSSSAGGVDRLAAPVSAATAQVRDVVTRLITVGQWRQGDPPILVIFDSGHDPMRLARRLADLPVQVQGRLRSAACCISRCRSASPAPGAGLPCMAGS
jgi:hypothetical protein